MTKFACVSYMGDANKAITCEKHPTPTVEELLQELNGVKIFSKLDTNHGYLEIELSLVSRYITTLATHKGLKRYTRLNFGTTSRCEIFQNATQISHSGHQGMSKHQ